MVFAILGAIAILAQSSEVWSDGYVELTLNKIYRTDTVPPDFERVSSPKVGHDFVVINLTFTLIEGREVVAGGSPVLFDSEGNNYTVEKMVAGISGLQFAVKEGKQVVYELISEGARELLLYPMPKDREPAHLEFSYLYAESWENVSIEEGKIEINLQVTPTLTPTPALTVSPVATPTSSPTPTPVVTPTPTPPGNVPGFEVIFAIAGLLAIAYLLRR